MNEENILDKWNDQNNRLDESLEQLEALAGVLIKLSEKQEMS